MDHNPSPTSSITLEGQILQLSELANQIYHSLQNNLPSCPDENLDDLAFMAETLKRIHRQVTEREEGRENLLALADIGQVINSSLKLDDVLRIVMDTIIRLTGAERGFLMLRDEQSRLSIRMARNFEQESLEASDFAISRTVVNQVITDGKPVLTTNARQDPRFSDQDSIIAYNLRSILCVPLKVKGELTGVIYADNRLRSGLFTESKLDLLAAFANQAAVAIENARLFESLRRTLAEVTELKNLMDDVFASIASGVITADLEDNITLTNRAAKEILDFNGSELIGHKLEEIIPLIANDLARYLNLVRQSNRHIVGLEFNPTLVHRGPVTLSLNLSPLKDAEKTTRGVAIVLEDLTEKKRLEAQRRLFERMISPAVIEQLNPDELKLGGQRAQITTLFADLRGFTGFSELYEPEQLVSVLNRYLGAATEAVLAQGGTIDKFLGDGVMAFFNAPIPQADHTLRAVKTALDLRTAILQLQQKLSPEFRLSFGVGIHFGEAVLGLIGTEKRLDYTAIGDSVNTAKRIQENAAAGQILISAMAYAQVAHQVSARQVGAIQPKGKNQPVVVYEILGINL